MLQEASNLARRGGRILSAGMCMQPDSVMPLVAGVKELSFQFCSYYRRDDFALTVDLLAAERIDASAMVTDRISLDELPAAFEALRTPREECKVIVQP
jgi:(R,R)-butanediol dehydrogenase/meso-butanediol dehydrogenase/diacetyl reductase